MHLPTRLTVATYGIFAVWSLLSVEQLFVPDHWTDKAESNPLYRRTQWAAVKRPYNGKHPAEWLYFPWLLAAILPSVLAWRGGRTRGRSFIYQVGLSSLGFHGLKILFRSLAFQAYTPGLLVGPTIVTPFAVWSWWVLLEEGVMDRDGLIDAALWALAIDYTSILVFKSSSLAYRRGGRFIGKLFGRR